MGLVLSAANVRGWTTGSGMEGPSVPVGGGGECESSTEKISTFPWSLFTKSPRRRMRVAFTCNVCGQRTTRAINPHAYTDGTVFVQVFMLLYNSFIFNRFSFCISSCQYCAPCFLVSLTYFTHICSNLRFISLFIERVACLHTLLLVVCSGRGKVCIHPTHPRPHLCVRFTWFVWFGV